MIKSMLICTDRVDFDVADRAAKPQNHEAALINADYEWEPIMIELLQLPDIAATVSVAHQLPTPR